MDQSTEQGSGAYAVHRRHVCVRGQPDVAFWLRMGRKGRRGVAV